MRNFDRAAHGNWCNAETKRTRCQYCKKYPIFYFECDHGCKVFFDELGDPWPLHKCEEYREHVRNS